MDKGNNKLAVTGKHYKNPEELEINTLENAIFICPCKNDVSFLIDSRLSQASICHYNPNLLLRFLFYVSDIY